AQGANVRPSRLLSDLRSCLGAGGAGLRARRRADRYGPGWVGSLQSFRTTRGLSSAGADAGRVDIRGRRSVGAIPRAESSPTGGGMRLAPLLAGAGGRNLGNLTPGPGGAPE